MDRLRGLPRFEPKEDDRYNGINFVEGAANAEHPREPSRPPQTRFNPILWNPQLPQTQGGEAVNQPGRFCGTLHSKRLPCRTMLQHSVGYPADPGNRDSHRVSIHGGNGLFQFSTSSRSNLLSSVKLSSSHEIDQKPPPPRLNRPLATSSISSSHGGVLSKRVHLTFIVLEYESACI